jgi:hypothetical protein
VRNGRRFHGTGRASGTQKPRENEFFNRLIGEQSNPARFYVSGHSAGGYLAGHKATVLSEFQGCDHGKMAEPGYLALTRFIAQRDAAQRP